jgi:hypothetical protein
MNHRPRPCEECPWRRDTPSGQFPRERYEALENTVGGPGEEVGLGGPIFACHKSAEGKELPCAGWLAVVGIEHLGVRVSISQGHLPPEVLKPADDWPDLFDSYEELVAKQAG